MHLSKFLSVKTPRKWEQFPLQNQASKWSFYKEVNEKMSRPFSPSGPLLIFQDLKTSHLRKKWLRKSGEIFQPNAAKNPWVELDSKKKHHLFGNTFPHPQKNTYELFEPRPGGKWIEKKWETSKGMCECLEIVGQRNLPNTFGRYLFNMCLFFRHFRVPQEMLECWHVQYAKKMQIRCNKNDKNGTFQRLLSLLPNWGFGVCFVFPARCGVASVFETSQHICCLCTLVVWGFQSRKGVETST